jgi:hypothetical protein
MVATRRQRAAEAEEERISGLEDVFQLTYKDLTPEQQEMSRHNRFLCRAWKIRGDKRSGRRHCVACLGDVMDFSDDGDNGYIGVMACDHLIHLKCLIRHADAHLDMKGIPSIDDPDAWRTMSRETFRFAAQERFIYRRLGAPCPACRLEFPMRHMTIFDSGAKPKGLQVYVQQTPRDWLSQHA